MIKQVLIVNKKLGMGRGKVGSQCGHGATKVFFDRGTITEVKDNVEAPYMMHIPLTKEMHEWVKGIFTKIVLYVNSDEELRELKRRADEMGIVNAIIEDCGLTAFHGIPTRTVLAIGPDNATRIDSLTSGLPLLN